MGDICYLLACASTAAVASVAGCDATTAANVCATTATTASARYLSIRFLYVELAFLPILAFFYCLSFARSEAIKDAK